MIEKKGLKRNYIINLDALRDLKEFPDEIFDTCITSPPYYGLRDYHDERQIGREENPKEYLKKIGRNLQGSKKSIKKRRNSLDCYRGFLCRYRE